VNPDRFFFFGQRFFRRFSLAFPAPLDRLIELVGPGVCPAVGFSMIKKVRATRRRTSFLLD
jgi:hypothetical protein